MTEQKHDIRLRLLEESDINENYLSWFKDKDVTEFLYARNLTKDQCIDHLREGISNNSYFMYAIIDAQSSQHIGNIKLGPILWQHRVADMSTVIGARAFWGKDLAAKAIRLGIQIAFEDYDIRKLHGHIDAANIGSIKAYTRAGWRVTGVFKGHHIRDDKAIDLVVVSCFNPKYFPDELSMSPITV